MERSNIPRPPYQPFPRGTMVFKSVIPERKLDESIINKLFLLATEGDYMKLKEYMYSNNVSLSSKNDRSESVLHVIIKNSNMTQHEKLELIKLCVQNGAQVTSYDMNNVTPLHLASKYQHEKIVEYLLSVGANIEAKDSQYKTPLFYAVSGNSTQCPIPEETKIKPIVRRSTEQKKEKLSNLSGLHTEMVKYLHSNDAINKYLVHIDNTFKDPKKMMQMYEEIETLVDADKTAIAEIIANSNLPETDKKRLIFDKLMESKKIINDALTKKLGDAVSSMSIKQNNLDGWGPDDKPEHKILEYNSVEQLTNTMKSVATSEYVDARRAVESVKLKVIEKIEVLNTYVTKWKSMQSDVLMFNRMFRVQNNGATWPVLLVNDIGIAFHMPQNDYYNNNTKSYKSKNINFNSDTNENDINNPIFATAINREKKFFRSTKEEIAQFKKQRKSEEYYQYLLTTSIPFSSHAEIERTDKGNGNYNVFEAQNTIRNAVDPLHININDATATPPTFHNSNDQQIYFIAVLQHYNTILREKLDNISTNMTNIATEFRRNNFNTVYNLFSTSMINVLEICFTLLFIKEFLNNNRLNLGLLKNEILQTARTQTITHPYMYEQLFDIVQKMDKVHTETEGATDEIYSILKGMVSMFNSLISSININMSQQHISSFYGANFDAVFNDDNRFNLPTMDISLKKLKELPSNFADFVKPFIVDNHEFNKRYLFETYVPQFTATYAPILYNDSVATPAPGYVGINPNGALSIMPNAQGSMQIINTTGSSDPKKKALHPIAGHFLHIHFRTIKYMIIRHIISTIHTKSKLPPSPLGEEITKLRTQISSLISKKDDDGILYVLLAKMIDRILSEQITMHIGNMATIIQKEILGEKARLKYDFYLDAKYDRKFLPLDKDTGFVLELNELFASLTDFHKRPTRYVTMIGDLADDDLTEKKKIHKVINFIYDGKSVESLCFKIDPEVTEILLQKGAQPNAKDILGNTPLFYANDIQHMDLIELLIRCKAVVNSDKQRNVRGDTVLTTSWNNYCENVVPLMVRTDEITSNMTKEIIKKFKKKTQYGNNVPRYVKLLLPICIYLLNHQLCLIEKGYPIGWTYEDHNNLYQQLSLDDHVMPLSEVNTDKLKLLGTKTTDLSMAHAKWLRKETSNMIKQKQSYEHQITNLETEKKAIDGSDSNSLMRKKMLGQTLSELRSKLSKIEKKIADTETTIIYLNNNNKTTLDADTDAIFVKPDKKLNLAKLTKHDSVAKMYDSMFKTVINKLKTNTDSYNAKLDLKTYASMWKTYLDGTMPIDSTQIISALFRHQENILKEESSIDKKMENMSLLTKYYECVLTPYIDNYFELSQELDENYALNYGVDIITHVAKHFIFVNLYHIIVKMLIQYVIERSNVDDGTKADYVHNTVLAILDNTIQVTVTAKSSRLLSYIMIDLPTKAVKCTLQIFNEEGDVDRETNIDKLFAHITKILEANTTMPLTKDSSMIKNLHEYIYPFFKDYVELFVKEMKNVMDGYLRSLKYQANHLKVLKLLVSRIEPTKL